MGISFIKLCFLAFLASLPVPSDCSNKALFIFGDSLFDSGNNNYINTTTSFQANFFPYGKTFFKYPTGRYSDGRLISDFIAEYAKLPLIRPFLQSADLQVPFYGLNFASSGAGALAETYSGLVIDLKMQERYFENVVKKLRSKIGDKKAKDLLSNAVYLFNVGSGDYSYSLSNNSTLPPEEYAKLVVGNFTTVIKEIYKKGGRKFGFLNMPPLNCTPSTRALNNGECLEEINPLVEFHNVFFNKKIKEMEKKLEGFKYSIFDFFGAVLERRNNPSKYGFKDVTNACCGSGPFRGYFSCGGKRGGIKEYEVCDNVGEYFFFDDVHMTEAAIGQLAELMWNGDDKITVPYNLKSLFELVV